MSRQSRGPRDCQSGYSVWPLPRSHIKWICCPNPAEPTQRMITEQQRLHLPGNPTPPPKPENVSQFLERLEADLQSQWPSYLALRTMSEEQISSPTLPGAAEHLYVFEENHHITI